MLPVSFTGSLPTTRRLIRLPSKNSTGNGTSQNAVFCQIWIALCIFLIIAIAKNRWKTDQSLYSFSQICGITPFEKVPLNEPISKSPAMVPFDDTPNLFSNSHFYWDTSEKY